MATRYFNWKLAIVLVVALVVFGAAAMALHQWQRNTRADQALPLGEKAFEQEQWEEAAVQLGRYVAVYGDNVPVLLKYAHAQLNRRPVTSGHVMHAVTAFRSVLRLEPGNTEAARRLTEVYLSMNTPGEAELIAGRYLEDRDEPVIRRLLAVALTRQRKFSQAATELNRIIAAHPSDVLAYELTGQLAEERPGDVNQPATFWFNEAVARNPELALAYVTRAGFYLRTNNRAQAMADLEQAERFDLSETEVRLRLIRELMNAGAWDKARGHLKTLQASVPTEQMLWRHWAELTLRTGAVDEMQTVAETGLKELASQPWDFMPVAIELLIRSGHYEQAGEYLSQMRQKDMHPPMAAFLEGLLAERQGRYREAIAAWQKAISLGYRPPTIHMMLASAFVRLRDTQSAIGQLRLLVSANPAHLDGHLMLARLLAQARDWPEVLEEARRVQQLSAGHTEAALLELQARTHMVAASPGPQSKQAWQDIENRLAQLSKEGEGSLQLMLLQAQTAMLQGKLPEAEAVLGALESKYPSEVTVALLRAELLASEGKEQEAIARFRETVARFPQAYEPVRSLALLLNRLDQRSESEAVIADAVARVKDPQARRDLGLLLADLYRRWAQNEKRYQWLTELVQESPDDIQLKRQLLTCDEVANDPGQVQKIVDEIKAIEGERGWQWRYEQARAWFDAKNFQDNYALLVKLLQENLLANPQDQASRLLLAATYEKAGEMQLAVPVYREALTRSPDNIPVLIRAVAALYKAGNEDEAREILDDAGRRNLYHPDLQKLQLQSYLRRGQLADASDILQDFVSQDPNDTSAGLVFALLLMRQQKFDEAEKVLDDLKTRLPDSVSVTAAQIQLHIQKGDAEGAIRLSDEAVERLHNAFAYLMRAQTYVALKRYDKALEDFGQAVSLEPRRADVWSARSDFYRATGRIREAVADMREALSLAPESQPVLRRAVSLFLASGDASLVEEAEVLLDRTLAANPDDVALKLLKARALASRGTGPASEQARRILRGLTDDEPRLAEAWELMGRIELQQGQVDRAVNVALRGLAHSPEDRRLLLLKAHAEAMTSPMSAVPTLRLLADQYPDDVEILIQLAGAYVDSEKPERAIELLRERLGGMEGPARRRCEIALASALYRSGQKDEAKLLFETLMRAEPDDVTPVLAFGQVLGRERRWAELNQLIFRWRTEHPDDTGALRAIASALAATSDREAVEMAEDLLRLTLARDPNSMSSLMLLGILMQREGRNEESAALNQHILELDPNNSIALNNLAWVLSEEKGQYDEALRLADRGLAIDSDYIDIIDTRGVIYYRLGRLREAETDLTRCIKLCPSGAASAVAPRFHLGRVYAQMNRKTEAVEQLTEALGQYERVGGLSREDLAEAKLLLERLQKRN